MLRLGLMVVLVLSLAESGCVVVCHEVILSPGARKTGIQQDCCAFFFFRNKHGRCLQWFHPHVGQKDQAVQLWVELKRSVAVEERVTWFVSEIFAPHFQGSTNTS